MSVLQTFAGLESRRRDVCTQRAHRVHAMHFRKSRVLLDRDANEIRPDLATK